MKGMFVLQTLPFVCGLFGPHLHPHRTKFVICGARTCTPFFVHACAPASEHKKNSKKNFFLVFFYLKLSFFTKKKSVRTCGAHPHLRVHARTRTHIFENFCAPLCTKIATPARVRMCVHAQAHTLKFLYVVCKMSTFVNSRGVGGQNWVKFGPPSY